MFSSSIFLAFLAFAAASPKPVVVEPLLAPAYITAQSFQYFYRKHNAFAAPIIAAPLVQTVPVPVTSPLIQSAPLIKTAAPLIKTGPIIQSANFDTFPVVKERVIAAPLIAATSQVIPASLKYTAPLVASVPARQSRIIQANPVYRAPLTSAPIFQAPLLKPSAVTTALVRNNFIEAQNKREEQQFVQRKASPSSKLVNPSLPKSRNDLNSRRAQPVYNEGVAQAPGGRPFVPETVSPDMVETFDPVVRNVPQQVAFNQRPVLRTNGFIPGFNPFFTTQ